MSMPEYAVSTEIHPDTRKYRWAIFAPREILESDYIYDYALDALFAGRERAEALAKHERSEN